MTVCLARPDRFGTMRCTACRVSWDSDDVAACPREAPPIAHQEAPLRCALTHASDALHYAFVRARARSIDYK